MSEPKHYLEADEALKKEYSRELDRVAKEMGRTGSRDDRVDWSAVNEKMKAWWKEKGYAFP
ncbi:MAG TPA: hypothetical protein EYH03_03565 [Chromatiales bacterium]|nr:hypothetical protein [Chromatiales bacterium]